MQICIYDKQHDQRRETAYGVYRPKVEAHFATYSLLSVAFRGDTEVDELPKPTRRL